MVQLSQNWRYCTAYVVNPTWIVFTLTIRINQLNSAVSIELNLDLGLLRISAYSKTKLSDVTTTFLPSFCLLRLRRSLLAPTVCECLKFAPFPSLTHSLRSLRSASPSSSPFRHDSFQFYNTPTRLPCPSCTPAPPWEHYHLGVLGGELYAIRFLFRKPLCSCKSV